MKTPHSNRSGPGCKSRGGPNAPGSTAARPDGKNGGAGEVAGANCMRPAMHPTSTPPRLPRRGPPGWLRHSSLWSRRRARS